MEPYNLRFEDLGTVGSFHTSTGSNLIRVTGRSRSAIIFQCILNEDNDGAPNAYGPPGIQPRPLDPLGDATNQQHPHFDAKGNNTFRWVGLVSRTPQNAHGLTLDQRLSLKDVQGRFPVVQTTGATRGYFVSTTALAADASLPETNPQHWWDAATVSYGALTPPLSRRGVALGDFGLVVRVDTGVADGFLYADAGRAEKVGESSRHLFRALFPNVDQENHPVSFMVFPGSRLNPVAATPDPIIRQRLADLAQADNADELIALMASGLTYRAFQLRGMGEVSRWKRSLTWERIISGLSKWGFSQWASVFRDRDDSDIMRLPIPQPGSRGQT
jgi:hypothetical protein